MNATTFSLSAPWMVFEFTLAFVAAGLSILAATTPVGNDILAIVGAILATFLSVLDARKSDKSRANTISVIIGSSFTGALAPGIFFYNIWPHLAERFTWHIWCGLGFLAGLLGWSIVLAVITFIKRRKDALLAALARRWIGPDFQPPEKNDRPS